jgi:hypothetical protein
MPAVPALGLPPDPVPPLGAAPPVVLVPDTPALPELPLVEPPFVALPLVPPLATVPPVEPPFEAALCPPAPGEVPPAPDVPSPFEARSPQAAAEANRPTRRIECFIVGADSRAMKV